MARIAAAELLARVEKGKAIPAVLLLGGEAFLRDSCRTLLIEKYVPEAARAWALSRFSAGRGEGQAALDQAQTMPMLSPQQVVFLEEAEAIEKLGETKRDDFVKALEAYLDNPAPFTTLVLEADSLDQRMKFAKLLAEKALVVAVSLGDNEQERRAAAVAQAAALASELGVALEAGVAEDLAEWVAEDLQLLKTEMEKLATYAGERRRIRRAAQRRLEVGLAASSGALFEVVHGHQRRHLLRHRGGDELVDRHVLALSEFPHRPVQGLGQPQTQCAHRPAPVFTSHCCGVDAATPNRELPAKSRTLCVMTSGHPAATASSSTSSSLGSRSVGRHR
jgi:hypothetical protein